MFQPLAITLLLCAISLGPGLSTCVAAPLSGRIVQSLNVIMQAEITDGHVAGAVVLIGDADGVLYRHAVGERVIGPHPQPMTAETVFDLASLTKPVATTTAILQLAERGRLSLDAPVSAYWPAFGQHGKQGITVRALLTHSRWPKTLGILRQARARLAAYATSRSTNIGNKSVSSTQRCTTPS